MIFTQFQDGRGFIKSAFLFGEGRVVWNDVTPDEVPLFVSEERIPAITTVEGFSEFVDEVILFFRGKIDGEKGAKALLFPLLLSGNVPLSDRDARILSADEQKKRLGRLTELSCAVVGSDKQIAISLDSLEQFLPGFRNRFMGVVRRLSQTVAFASGNDAFEVLAWDVVCEEFRNAMQGVLSAARTEVYHEKWGIHDALNRRTFNSMRLVALSFAQRNGLPCSQLFIDLDHFKSPNDRYGQVAGDAIIDEFFRRLREVIRREDILCAAGGDEAIVFMQNTDLNGATVVVRRIRDAMSVPFVIPKEKVLGTTEDIVLNGKNFPALTVSMGIAAVSSKKIIEDGEGAGNETLDASQCEQLALQLDHGSGNAMKAAKDVGRDPETGRLVVRRRRGKGRGFILEPDPKKFKYRDGIVTADQLTPEILAYLDAIEKWKASKATQKGGAR